MYVDELGAPALSETSRKVPARDRIPLVIASASYFFGTLWAKLLTQRVGQRTHIHPSVRYWWPSHITIGSDCEIRFGTFLDARSTVPISISIGDDCRIKDYVGLAAYGGEIRLGCNVLVGRLSTIFGHGGVYIGDYTMLGPNTAVLSGNHVTFLKMRPFQQFGTTKEPIHIAENVWVGSNTCILGGSKIDKDVVVAAGAVVRGHLESGWIYGGVPAKKLKRLSDVKPADLRTYLRSWDLFTLHSGNRP